MKYYTDFYFETTDAVGLIRADIISKATDHIPDMVELIKTLEQNLKKLKPIELVIGGSKVVL